MDQGLDPGLGQPRGEAVAFFGLDHVKVPRRLGPVGDVGQGQVSVGQRRVVISRDGAAAVVIFVEFLELHPEHRRMDRIEPRIDAKFLIHIAN